VKGKVAHLCQGYEPIKYLAGVKKDFIPEKYERGNVFFLFGRLIDKRKYRRRIKRVESIYALPTVKAAVSKHLVELEDCINKGLMVARNFTLETTKTHLFTFIKELD
jgi:hypothetical protein